MVGLLIENKFLEKINAIFGGKLDHVQFDLHCKTLGPLGIMLEACWEPPGGSWEALGSILRSNGGPSGLSCLDPRQMIAHDVDVPLRHLGGIGPNCLWYDHGVIFRGPCRGVLPPSTRGFVGLRRACPICFIVTF